MISAVVFDCGGVVLESGDLSPYDSWEKRLGLTGGELAKHLWESDTWSLAEQGKITDAELWQHVGRKVGIDDAATIECMREEIWTTWGINANVLALIDRIRSRYRVAMLSNATDALESILQKRYGIADRFELIVNSARVGVAKPDEAIYQHLLHTMDIKPGEVVFVDDRAENIAAAAQMGMHVAWYVHAKELERQLAAYLRIDDIDGQPKDGIANRTDDASERDQQPSPAHTIARV